MLFRSHARSIIPLECPPARRNPATNTGFAPPPALILYLNLLLRTIGLVLAIACFVLAATIWETRAVLAAFETGPDATVSTTPVEVYDTEKCSEELMAMVEFENVPATLLAVRTVNLWPTVGAKPLTNAAVSVPPRLATPDTCS